MKTRRTTKPAGELVSVTAPAKIDVDRPATIYRNAAGDRIPGVTTVLGLIPKYGLLKWAFDVGRQGGELEAARERAASLGRICHALCVAHLRGMEVNVGSVHADLLHPAGKAFDRFREWWQRESLTVIATELVMISERLQVGGTADIVGQRPNGRLVLCDLKTGRLYDEHLIQAATYSAIYEEVTGRAIDEVLVVLLGKTDDDQVEVREVDDRAERVAAFCALAAARKRLQAAGCRV